MVQTFPSSPIYLAIDLKSFYASVECVERNLDPLTTRLVVADAARSEKTICLAVTPPLKAYGLSGRPRLFEVTRLAQDVKRRTGEELSYIIAPPRMALYLDYSARIYAVYLKYVSADDIYPYSIDEVFIDVTRYLHLYPQPDKRCPGQTRPATPRELATLMIQDVFHTTGITAAAGIGTNLYLAKIAMDIVAKHAKPDANGVRIGELDEFTYRYLLWDHKPLTDFWRIGPGTAKRLSACHIETMGELARFSLQPNVDGIRSGEDWLYKTFGVDAEILIDHAWGYEPCTMQAIKAYQPSTHSLCEGQVLPRPYSFAEGEIIVREMVDSLIWQLMEKHSLTDSLTLHIGYERMNDADKASTTDRYGFPVPAPAHGTISIGSPSYLTSQLLPPLLDLFHQIVNPQLLIRRVTLTANRLIPFEGAAQLDLFSDTPKLMREKKLQQAMLSLKQRFGKNAILKGTNFLTASTMRDRNCQIGGHRA